MTKDKQYLSFIAPVALRAVVVALCAMPLGASAAVINLFDYALNVDGTTTCWLGPCDLDFQSDFSAAGAGGSFDFLTGLGTVELSLAGTGAHHVSLFLDHEIDEADNTFFNEIGSDNGTAAAGQSWEIDEPYYFGDIFFNLIDSTPATGSFLDNSVGFGVPEDVSMALGWDFVLAAGETANLSWTVSTIAPTAGFYLSHTDPDSATAPTTIYFSSTLDIVGDVVEVSEPGTLWLIALGLALLLLRRRGLDPAAARA